MRKLLLFLGLSFTLTSFAQEPVKVTDLLKIRSIGDIRLNKDGSQAVYTVTSIEQESDTKASKWDYKYSTQIWLTPTDG
ncbi:hypothetical protein ACQ86N_25095 [Puia sp. P3]|uniref:hypothetical protein n=1 Tax=Puia sp. P3 TaxID=3423952 RepID=UPI003D669F07